jgi:hypothetical protein
MKGYGAMAEEDTDSKRYEIAILQMRYEGQLLWQRFGAFFLLTDAIIQEAEDLDAHPRDDREAERAPKVNVTLTRWRAIPWEQRRLMGVFVGFLIGTLAMGALRNSYE